MAKRKNKMPKEGFVYVFDEENGVPLYAVTTDIDDITEGETYVGVYKLKRTDKFVVKKELQRGK